ncbi:MAG TPA: HAMP domain-containing sensor histidine kinase [Flavobacterium sp.]|nr:HAMP domain-containing sensor histidine kinase [Flavobacterium sp.]
MKSKNYKYIMFFITAVIVATISLQIRWNIKNFRENQRRLINDVQIAFDNSIEHYYTEDTKERIILFIGSEKDSNFQARVMADTNYINLTKKKKIKNAGKKTENGTVNHFFSRDSRLQQARKRNLLDKIIDSLNNVEDKQIVKQDTISGIRMLKGKQAFDFFSKTNSKNKILVEIPNDSIEIGKIEKIFNRELARKDIQVRYGIQHFKADTVFQKFKIAENFPLRTFSDPTFLPQKEKLQLLFSNPTILIFKRSMAEILLSLLLSLSIICCLLYLLRTINRQKKIDEMKNDLISNITHEFKTPITTVTAALEGIKNFNAINDAEKNDRYLSISNQQLKKLEIMVEKLLETASLETDKIILNKEPVDIAALLEANIEKHQINAAEKHFLFISDFKDLPLQADLFHLENAISNIIDNAVKYGGDFITVSLKKEQHKTIILIEDNGKGIEKKEREKIFEKFYRIQKGNVHDVKGFGIGLYYSKKIIEKHKGSIELLGGSKTIFKITLPDE